uniref:Uncharacterized protein n=1 Tax=Tanacetum cinerariifolium TaxID=118510 RepID=A0A699JQD1_TANCI|nr:hypothetical protein [Tanacetum cinerariifolium]
MMMNPGKRLPLDVAGSQNLHDLKNPLIPTTPQKGPTQNWLMTLVASSSTDKLLKSFDELMSTPIDFSAYIMNDMPQDQEGNLGKTPQKGPTQNWLMTLVASSSTDKLLKSFDELMSTPIDFSAYIMNGESEIFNSMLSYQKTINVTKPDTVRPNLQKRHSYTSYQDSQGFIYVDNIERNRLMHSDKLYKFSDDTLTRLLTSLEDITKNIYMEYLPKRRWSSLEKKRANFMIKEINKLLKERRMMRSLEKFIGGRLYDTDPRLFQRTI